MKKHAFKLSKVTGITHSPSEGGFVEITMGEKLVASKKILRATPHHTFPLCNDKTIKKAMNIKVGDCFVTEYGHDTFKTVKELPVRAGDTTYTIQMEAGVRFISIGGIFTHAATSERPLATGMRGAARFE